MMLTRALSWTFAAAVTLCAAPALAGDVSEITADEFYGAAYFEQALEHPRVAKQKSRRRQLAMVARDMGWGRRGWKKLKAAIEEVEALNGDPVELAEQAVRDALEQTRVEGRVLEVLVNASEPKHVVMYVRWRGSKSKEAVKEASTIAAVVAEKVPFVSTLSLAAIHPKSPADTKTTVWEGKISASSMGSINEKRIERYADRLYKRLFEEVKSRPF